MSEAEYVMWSDQNLRTWNRTRAARPCEDCMTSWAADQRRRGRCNGELSGDA